MKERLRQWLLPGMGVKRWVLANFIGVSMIIVGLLVLIGLPIWERFGWFFQPFYQQLLNRWYAMPLGILLVVVGLALAYTGVRRMAIAVTRLFLPNTDAKVNLRELLYQRRQKGRGPKIVVIGGGSGLSMLLRGLKEYSGNLTAVVTVADDGGSSGRLREELGVLPPGDIRNCLVALSDSENLLTDLFDYRFDQGAGLAGHSFGNLFLAAMSAVKDGNFLQAIKDSSTVLAVRGQVLPATLENVTLVAEFDNGEILRGESEIGRTARRISKLSVDPARAEALPEVIAAIEDADAIILGPGSLYTSIIPNLRIAGVVEAIQRSPALVVYICNIMTQPGETTGHSAADHVEALIAHAEPNLIDYVLINDGPIDLEKVPGYQAEGGRPVVADLERVERCGVRIISGDYVKRGGAVVRHDTELLAKELIDLIVRERYTLERRRALIEHLQKMEV